MGRQRSEASHSRSTNALLAVARFGWWLGAAIVAVGGATAAVFIIPWAALAAVIGSAAVVSLVGEVSTRRPGRPTERGVRGHRVAATSCSVASGVVVAVGVVAVTGLSGLVLLVLLAATSAPAVARYCVFFPELIPLHVILRRAPSLGTRVGRAVPEIPLTALSTEQLCRAWRHSSSTLGRARSVADRTAATTIRARYLDELERRDPVGFSTWITMSPRPGRDPARYVRQAPDTRSRWKPRRWSTWD